MNFRLNNFKLLPPVSGTWVSGIWNMPAKVVVMSALLITTLALVGCGDASNQQAQVSKVNSQGQKITGDALAFSRVFAHNCAGCHGMTGNDGSAPPLNNALFLSLASHDYLYNTIANGRTDHMMPSWIQPAGKTMGKSGNLTKQQINQVIRGMHDKWDGPAKDASGAPQLALHKTSSGKLKGDAKAGEKIYNEVYASMGKDVWLNQMDQSDQSWYLKVASNQLLRRLLITGRRSFNLPDYKQAGLQSKLGAPLTDQQVTNVVAYLATKRGSVIESTNE